MWKQSVTGVPTCDFSLRQDSTDMGELFCKLEDQVYVLLLSCRVCLYEICLKFYFAYLF